MDSFAACSQSIYQIISHGSAAGVPYSPTAKGITVTYSYLTICTVISVCEGMKQKSGESGDSPPQLKMSDVKLIIIRS